MRLHKGLSFITIFGFAAGLACCILITLFTIDQLGFDRHYAKAERIYRVGISASLNSKTIQRPGIVRPPGRNHEAGDTRSGGHHPLHRRRPRRPGRALQGQGLQRRALLLGRPHFFRRLQHAVHQGRPAHGPQPGQQRGADPLHGQKIFRLRGPARQDHQHRQPPRPRGHRGGAGCAAPVPFSLRLCRLAGRIRKQPQHLLDRQQLLHLPGPAPGRLGHGRRGQAPGDRPPPCRPAIPADVRRQLGPAAEERRQIPAISCSRSPTSTCVRTSNSNWKPTAISRPCTFFPWSLSAYFCWPASISST